MTAFKTEKKFCLKTDQQARISRFMEEKNFVLEKVRILLRRYGPYQECNGNTASVMDAGHQVPDHIFDNSLSSAIVTSEIFDYVIVGSRISRTMDHSSTRSSVGDQEDP